MSVKKKYKFVIHVQTEKAFRCGSALAQMGKGKVALREGIFSSQQDPKDYNSN